MSEPTLQQEIEALRPATEGTLQQMAKGIPLMGRGPDGKAKVINVDENGNVKVQQSGRKPEVESLQYAEPFGTVATYTRAEGAEVIEVRVESGRVRVASNGELATATTGIPIGEGFRDVWAAPAISVYYVSDATITVVSI